MVDDQSMRGFIVTSRKIAPHTRVGLSQSVPLRARRGLGRSMAALLTPIVVAAVILTALHVPLIASCLIIGVPGGILIEVQRQRQLRA